MTIHGDPPSLETGRTKREEEQEEEGKTPSERKESTLNCSSKDCADDLQNHALSTTLAAPGGHAKPVFCIVLDFSSTAGTIEASDTHGTSRSSCRST